jgi:hypothetical protein
MPSQPRTNLYKSCILSCLVAVGRKNPPGGRGF